MHIRKFKLLMRSIASILCFFMTIYPFYSFGIEASAIGREGQSYGDEISSAFHFPTQVGGMIEFGDGESINPNDLAPKGDGFYVEDPNFDELQNVYDSATSMDGAGMSAQNKIYRDASKSDPDTLSGAAYKIILNTQRARDEFPDFTNDPLVVGSGQAAFDQGLIDSFGDCTVDTSVEETTRPVRVPDPEYCTRVTAPVGDQSCKIRNDIKLTTQTVNKTVTLTGVPLTRSHRKRNAPLYDPHTQKKVLAHLYDEVCGNSKINPSISVTLQEYYGASGYGYLDIPPPFWNSSTGIVTGSSPKLKGQLNPSNYAFPALTVQPSCANGLDLQFDSYAASRWSSYVDIARMDLKVTYRTTETTVDNSKSSWGPQECIGRALGRGAEIVANDSKEATGLYAYSSPLSNTHVGSFIKPGGLGAFNGLSAKSVANDRPYDGDFCSTKASVTNGAKNESECSSVVDEHGSYHKICPGNRLYDQLKPSPIPGIPKHALEVTVLSNCSSFNQGQMDCYEDIHGEVHCPYNDGSVRNECKELEENPSCAFIKSECIEGARGEESGYCYAYEDEYDCGVSVNIPSYEKTEDISCGGPIRCMGSDCLDPMQPPSAANDFAKAAALLDAAQSMSQDMNCNPDGSGCTVFTGESKECKTAVGGMVNCCKKPKGISLSEYITVIRAAPKFNSAMRSLADSNNPFSSVGGGYKAIADPVANSFQTITRPVAGHVENIGGAIKGMKDTAIETIDKVATKAVDSVKNALGKGVANEAGKNAASEGIVSQMMNSPAMAYLQTVMAIYTVYVVATVIVSIIWKCTKKEFELGTQRQLKSCSKVGTYCRKKVLGACVEKRQSYCCFSSPLSRIMQEQMRPQLGMSFGRAKSPDCSGIPVERFGEVNWDSVNLDEWLGILQATNNFPETSGLNLESMTGSGSNFDTGGRLDSLNRNLDRLDGADIDEARSEAAKTVPITTGSPND